MSGIIGGIYDALLCGGMLWVALQVVRARERFLAIVLFMVHGLVMAVTWARLGAPDLALAEAIIGTGVTGALLLNACQAALSDAGARSGRDQPEPGSGLPRPVIAGLCLGAGIALASLMVLILDAPGPTAQIARDSAAEHTLGNPVTAVLLDFRGYDTLLEMAVLLAAFVGARVVMDQAELPALHPPTPADPPMVGALLGMATPVLVLMALYLFHAGSHAPGGAFQAGALLGSLGVLFRLTGRLEPQADTAGWLRAMLVGGLAVFTLIAVVALAWAPRPLSYPADALYPLVLIIEFALMLSIAATLVLLFSATPGFRPWHRGRL